MQSEKQFKVGLDVHGVIDTNPAFFKAFTTALRTAGFAVHVLTGPTFLKAKAELDRLEIPYDHLFSITDYCALQTKVEFDEKGNPHVHPYWWDKAKATYCKDQAIDLHIDDSDIYHHFFKTPYARFLSCDTKRKQSLEL